MNGCVACREALNFKDILPLFLSDPEIIELFKFEEVSICF